MKIAVVGGGGREHAIIEKLSQSSKVDSIYALPGNGGISKIADCVDIKATDIDGICKFCVDNKVDLAVVAPDDPLVLGAVDKLNACGIKTFGPNKAAAVIEGSKAFAKQLMKKYNIPTARYKMFDDMDKAYSYITETGEYPVVIKADGLALGKGVIIAQDNKSAKAALESIMKEKIFGKSGNRVVIEEFLSGPEVSVLAFCDGKTICPMVSSMDHKRALDGDLGPNTGGMGTIAPNPYYTPEIAKRCMDEIFLPTVKAMANEGRPFSGCLYFGLMITKDGPKVIEYNCRFGDPETQVVLPLLETDLLDIMLAIWDKKLDTINVKFSDNSACCVIIASGGYPAKYETGKLIEFGDVDDVIVYHAGTRLENGCFYTSGGRVLGLTAVAKSPESARAKAYKAAQNVKFEGSFYRKDIGLPKKFEV